MSLASLQLLKQVSDIARRAGQEILAVYSSGTFATTRKSDDSPLTLADTRAHRAISSALQALTPEVPVLSEEGASVDWAVRAAWPRHWLVDPLDGTKEFLSHNGEFTVNVALIEAHEPVLGVVHVPVRGTSYQGLPGVGAWREVGAAPAEPIRVSAMSASVIRVVGSRSHRGDSLAPFLRRLGAHELLPVGSSLKFCMIAEGAADVYPRLGPTSEWDTAAAHAVTVGAGGSVCTLEGRPLRYNLRASVRNPDFVAFGPRDQDWMALLSQVQPPAGA